MSRLHGTRGTSEAPWKRGELTTALRDSDPERAYRHQAEAIRLFTDLGVPEADDGTDV